MVRYQSSEDKLIEYFTPNDRFLYLCIILLTLSVMMLFIMGLGCSKSLETCINC